MQTDTENQSEVLFGYSLYQHPTDTSLFERVNNALGNYSHKQKAKRTTPIWTGKN